MKTKKLIVTLVFILGFINLISASISCDYNSVVGSYEASSDYSFTIHCINNGNESVSITKSGDYFSLSDSVIGPSPSEKNIILNFDPTAPVGYHSGSIQFSDDTSSIPLFFNVYASEVEPGDCTIDIFPTVLTNIKIQQGEKKTRNIQLNVPTCYGGSVTVNGVALQSDEKPIQLGEISLGKINPGNSIMIPIELDASGVSTGHYSDTIQFLIYDSEGDKLNVPQVSISILVSAGINPISNLSLDSLPSCSVDSIELNLNNTYKMTCTRDNPNINVWPIIDNFYLSGVDVKETGTQYVYLFKAKSIGNTKISAKFVYNNGEIGTHYEQDLRITSSGNSAISGINLDFLFYQNNNRISIDSFSPGNIIVRVIDNSTGNIIDNKKIYLDGIEINDTFDVRSEKEYELMVSSPGYITNTINFFVNKTPIDFLITPEKSTYTFGESINLTSSEEGVSYLVDNVVIDSYFTLNKEGNVTIEAKKEGRLTSNKTILVLSQINLGECNIKTLSWSKGDKIECDISKSTDWKVFKDNDEINSGSGSKVLFKIDDYGYYEIKSGDSKIYSRAIDKPSSKWNPLEWEFVKKLGYWWVVIILVIGFIVYNLFKDKDKHRESPTGFLTNVNTN